MTAPSAADLLAQLEATRQADARAAFNRATGGKP